jgi:RNA polymerase sigma-70 factor, ECF subfamily
MRGESVKADQVLEESRPRKEDRESSGAARPPGTLHLVRQAQAGDQAAFARLVQPHMRKTFHVALKITRNREDAEDASQQTLLKAFANIRQFQGASQFSTWLIRIAMNEALMVMRKRRSEDAHLTYDCDSGEWPTAIERICAADTMQPEVLYAKREHHEALREAIGSLRETLRVVVWMLGIEEHKSKDAAKILNLSESAVKIRFSRARQELRECLAGRI